MASLRRISSRFAPLACRRNRSQTAAEKLLAGLTEPQRQKTRFAVDDPEWRKWMNQRLLRASGRQLHGDDAGAAERPSRSCAPVLSAKGLKLTRDIMRLNQTLAELNDNDFDEYGEWRYHITVMGTPSASEPWGWQLDGHHAIINYFVLGDQVVMTPISPARNRSSPSSGKYKGTTVLQDEQNQGLALINALTDAQRRKRSWASKTGNENLTEAWKDNVVLDYAGVLRAEI